MLIVHSLTETILVLLCCLPLFAGLARVAYGAAE